MKKINKVKTAIVLVIILVIIATIISIIFNRSGKNIITDYEEIQAKYYVVQKDYRYGVIDTEGNQIVEIKYDDIDIPNPERDVFVCTKINENEVEETKILNGKQEEILNQYKNVSPIELKNDENETQYEKYVLQYEKDGKYGLIDYNGKKVTDAIYDKIEALKYKEGDLLVKQQDQYGVLNNRGKVVIKPKYDSIEGDGYYHNESKYAQTGYIVCKKESDGYRYGYINSERKQVLKNEYSEIYRVLEAQDKQNVYLIARRDGKVGFIKNNNKILDYEYQNIEYDSLNGLIKVQKNTSYGVYNINGEEILQVKYDEISFRGKYIYAQKEDQVSYFTLNGQEVKNLNYLSINETENEDFYTSINSEGLYGILDKNEKVLVENEYSYLEYLYGDYFIAIQDDKLGVIKSNDDIILPFEYDTIDKIDDTNLVKATKQDESEEFFSKDLKIILGIENPMIERTGDIIRLYSSKQNKYFDKEGNEKKEKEAFPNNILYTKEENGQWGFEDKEGNRVVECKYEYVTELNQYGYAGIKKDGKWGCIDKTGHIVVEPKYEITDENLPIFIGEYYTLEKGNEAIFYGE